MAVGGGERDPSMISLQDAALEAPARLPEGDPLASTQRRPARRRRTAAAAQRAHPRTTQSRVRG